MVVLLVYHKLGIKTPIYGIFSSFLDINDYGIIKLYPISIFSGNLFTLLYHLDKKYTYLCFGNTLHGCIVGLPQINDQKPKYGIFSSFLDIKYYSIIKLYPKSIFLENYLPYCIT